MIITVTLNPAIDKTSYIEKLKLNSLNRINNLKIEIGGKGINVSKTLKSLNEETICLGFIGGYTGNLIKEQLDLLDIKHSFTNVKENTRVNLKIFDNDFNLTEINEPGPNISIDDINDLTNKLETILKKDDILILSGSASSSINTNIYEKLSKIAYLKQSKAILDADGELLANGLKGPISVLKPNKYELCAYFNIPLDTDNNTLLKLSKSLLNENLKLIVLSLGENGSFFITKNEIYKVDKIDTTIVSTVGAGDAMVAGIAYGLHNNLSLVDTIKISTACATASIKKEIGKPINLDEINKIKPLVKYYKL